MVGLIEQNMTGLPGADFNFIIEMLLVLLVSALRIGAFLLSSPIFGARWLPLQVRVLMAFAFASTVINQPRNIDFFQLTTSTGVFMMLTEIAIGLTAGLILTISFSAILLAGEKIASTAGLGYAAQVDPSTGGQTPVVSQLLYLFLLVVFLSVDGHLLAIGIMLNSYEILPIGETIKPGVLIGSGIAASSSMFLSATLIMMPIVMVLLLINAINGVVTRSSPQLNLFSFAFPVTLLSVFVLLYFSASKMGDSSVSLIDGSLAAMQTMIEDLVNG